MLNLGRWSQSWTGKYQTWAEAGMSWNRSRSLHNFRSRSQSLYSFQFRSWSRSLIQSQCTFWSHSHDIPMAKAPKSAYLRANLHIFWSLPWEWSIRDTIAMGMCYFFAVLHKANTKITLFQMAMCKKVTTHAMENVLKNCKFASKPAHFMITPMEWS